MTSEYRSLALGLGLAALLASGTPRGGQADETLDVAVTIKPIHSLAAAVMEGVGTPTLLLKGATSPHAYALKPSDARTLSSADVVVRVSEQLETFLNRAIETLPQESAVVDLDEVEGLTLLPLREGGAFEPHEHEDEHEEGEDHDHHAEEASHDHDHGEDDHKAGEDHDGHEAEAAHDGEHGGYNTHIWLDPHNAAVIADLLATRFAAVRPQFADRFKANAAKLKHRLNQLDAELKAATADLKGRPFVVFHDAYPYFEARYGVEAAGAITVSPERQPGAARLREIRDKIGATKAVCVFSEPQFEPKLVATLIEGTDARSGVLDPLGADIEEGPEQYFTLMRRLGDSLRACLAS